MLHLPPPPLPLPAQGPLHACASPRLCLWCGACGGRSPCCPCCCGSTRQGCRGRGAWLGAGCRWLLFRWRPGKGSCRLWSSGGRRGQRGCTHARAAPACPSWPVLCECRAAVSGASPGGVAFAWGCCICLGLVCEACWDVESPCARLNALHPTITAWLDPSSGATPL